MGYKQAPWVLNTRGVTPTEKMVLMCLTLHANNSTRKTWVSTTTIAEECGYSKSSRGAVRRALQSLRSKGLIAYEEQPAGRGEKQSSNTYLVNWHLPPGSGDTIPPGSGDTIPPAQETPDPGSGDTTNEELNEEVLMRKGFTSDFEKSEKRVSPATQKNHGRNAAAQADPVSETFYKSEDRKILIVNIEHIALLKDSQDDARFTDAVDQLVDNLSIAFNLDDSLDDLIRNQGWQPPKKCTDRLEAAKWLNTLLSKWKTTLGGNLTWRGDVPELEKETA